MHVTVGKSRKVHRAYVEGLAAEGLAVTLYVTVCGLYERTELLGQWMKEAAGQPVTCLRCKAPNQDRDPAKSSVDG